MRTLVTGATGFVGSHLEREWRWLEARFEARRARR
jgi:thioester reductase-like protein